MLLCLQFSPHSPHIGEGVSPSVWLPPNILGKGTILKCNFWAWKVVTSHSPFQWKADSPLPNRATVAPGSVEGKATLLLSVRSAINDRACSALESSTTIFLPSGDRILPPS